MSDNAFQNLLDAQRSRGPSDSVALGGALGAVCLIFGVDPRNMNGPAKGTEGIFTEIGGPGKLFTGRGDSKFIAAWKQGGEALRTMNREHWESLKQQSGPAIGAGDMGGALGGHGGGGDASGISAPEISAPQIRFDGAGQAPDAAWFSDPSLLSRSSVGRAM